MTKSEKIADEIVEFVFDKIETDGLITKHDVAAIIKPHLEYIHNEAVLATIMAKNKKNYEEPKYVD